MIKWIIMGFGFLGTITSCQNKEIATQKPTETAIATKNDTQAQANKIEKTSKNNADLESAILQVIKAYQNEDLETLNTMVHPEKKCLIVYAMGAYQSLATIDKIKKWKEDEYDSQALYFSELELPLDIQYTALPTFSCDDMKWNKPAGIYIDTSKRDHNLSEIAKTYNEIYKDDPETQYSKAFLNNVKAIENQSFKVIAIGKVDTQFIFYLSQINGKWYIVAIDKHEVCDA